MRGQAPRARTDLVERIAAVPNIVQLFQTRITAIEGTLDKGVESVRIVTEGQCESTIATAGVFVFIGLEPNTSFLPVDLARDEEHSSRRMNARRPCLGCGQLERSEADIREC